jgi:hypothetical protein
MGRKRIGGTKGEVTDPCVLVLNHACQKGRLVAEVAHAELLEAADALVGDALLTPPTVGIALAGHLCADARHRELTDIRDDDERAGERALVAGLGPLDDLSPEDDVERARHGTRRNFVRVLLNADLLPIRELGLLDIERPARPV